ncbi:MAG: DegQ family serine endoprotease [Burkholderiaceae bacterium]|nr:DegQ family serine endoprotease [Burkholderiaceae bacterium]
MKRFLSVLAVAWFAGFVPTWGQGDAHARGLPEFADLVERVGPAVVNIRTAERVSAAREGRSKIPLPPGIDEDDPFYEFFRRFFPPRQGPAPKGNGRGEVPRGVGSGFLISADGLLLTNHHVVDGADEIYVTLSDKRELKGKLLGSDRRTDVALVKIDVTGQSPLKIGDPQRLRVGEWVLAIGSPFGLDNTVTAGIVSAKGRDTGDYLPFIQTDVAVNPGNSGGPLINMDGEVVGINSQIYSRTGGFMGISFAIPIDEAMRVAEQLRTKGKVIRGRIGVGIAEVTKDIAGPLGLPKVMGSLVRSVEPGAPADRGGVEVGDIIVQFGGREITKSSDLPRIVGGTAPGTKVSMRVWRRGQYVDLDIVVGRMEPDKNASKDDANDSGRDAAPQLAAENPFGLAVSDIPARRKAQLRLRNGVLVDAVDGPAEAAGIRKGDILLALDNKEIVSASQFGTLVGKIDRDKTHVLLVRRGDSAQYVPLRPVEQ